MKPARDVIAGVLDQQQSDGIDAETYAWADEVIDALIGEGYAITLSGAARIEFGPNLTAALVKFNGERAA